MTDMNEIAKEKQRLNEALARLDAQREKLAREFAELEATERVLARYSRGTRARKPASAKMSATKAAAPAQSTSRRSTPGGKSSKDRSTSPSLGDRVLALATGKTRQEITTACEGVRANHVGVIIARHKRAGRIEERDGRLYATG
jgi:hypothetical protein